jgi:hypothetical protein
MIRPKKYKILGLESKKLAKKLDCCPNFLYYKNQAAAFRQDFTGAMKPRAQVEEKEKAA